MFIKREITPARSWQGATSTKPDGNLAQDGLPVHVAVNLSSALALADTYRRIYGHSNNAGLPEIVTAGAPTPLQSDIAIDQDTIIAAPLWHDWAKTMVFQWTAEGSEFAELNFGGAGKTDKFGTPGDSRTGGHHIIGIAEAMKRGLSKEFVVAQASAHSAPTGGNEYLVVNWLRTGAILAQIDPVAAGYLTKDELGRFRLPVLSHMGAERLQILYAGSGVGAVSAELDKLKKAGII